MRGVLKTSICALRHGSFPTIIMQSKASVKFRAYIRIDSSLCRSVPNSGRYFRTQEPKDKFDQMVFFLNLPVKHQGTFRRCRKGATVRSMGHLNRSSSPNDPLPPLGNKTKHTFSTAVRWVAACMSIGALTVWLLPTLFSSRVGRQAMLGVANSMMPARVEVAEVISMCIAHPLHIDS